MSKAFPNGKSGPFQASNFRYKPTYFLLVKPYNLTKTTRILSIISGIALLVVLFLPIWRIDLEAPQYPEGLALFIHANDLKGDVEIINGLNHYIGMKQLHTEDFLEFKVLPYCIVFFSILFLSVALFNRKRLFYLAFSLFVVFGVGAMVDFWKWEYDYGHNLSPGAPIVVPGMAYQPPLIGFKQLLNFGAYSFPHIGGYLFIVSGLLLAIGVYLEWTFKNKSNAKPILSITFLAFTLLFSGCETKPEKIIITKENCEYCKMTIMDARFGAELITPGGRIYKFDDPICLKNYLSSKKIDANSGYKLYFTEFEPPYDLIPSNQCFWVENDSIAGPMQGKKLNFRSADKQSYWIKLLNGKPGRW
ncbi:MAG: hypothetical protein K1X82_08420 [Bacteroidia bacterium]|nr:hypothetical protein [Bacteroidia bacterium]